VRLEDKLTEAGDLVPNYKLFNTAADEARINAQITTDQFDSIRSMDVFSLPRGATDPKGVILHEVNHVVQQINHQDMGTSGQRFSERVREASIYSQKQAIGRAVQKGDITPESSMDDINKFIDDLARKHNMPDENPVELARARHAGDLTGRQRWVANVHRELQTVLDIQTSGATRLEGVLVRSQIWADRAMRDVRVMMEELGELAAGPEAQKMANQILDKMSFEDMHKLAFRRYRGQQGEVGSRLTEALLNEEQASILARAEPPFTQKGLAEAGVTGVPPTPIIGDLARQADLTSDLQIP
jgi:hypothetical protein